MIELITFVGLIVKVLPKLQMALIRYWALIKNIYFFSVLDLKLKEFESIKYSFIVFYKINITIQNFSFQMDLIDQTNSLLQYTIQLYYDCANQTQKYWKSDNQAALKIQSNFKLDMKRKEFKRKKAAVIKIQTQFRAYYARKQFKKYQIKDYNQKNLLYFANQAITIQKSFRGFFVRKYIHNFYLRKEQLKALQRKNQQFKQSLDQFGKAQAIQAQEYKKELSRAQFSTLAKNLHHLTSTRNIPGVYNSPFMFQKPKVFEKNVQEHLKQAFKRTYRWRGVTREDMLKHNTIKANTIK